MWITPKSASADPFIPGAQIPGERIVYHVKDADRISIEFWNAQGDDATKVVLPRAMIEEWAQYIAENRIAETTTPSAYVQAVKDQSSYSGAAHAFLTHLKAAAFALLRSRGTKVIPECYAIVPVGADWTSNEHILGYPDNLNGGYVQQTALKIILQAVKHPDLPHFLILDEMNLSHVERYFADVLSLIESETELWLHHDTETNGTPKSRGNVPNTIKFPQNLFVIGTVNVDETTYMFSPKVLDRANVLEFRVSGEEMADFLQSPATLNLDKLSQAGFNGAAFADAFVQSAKGDYDATLAPGDRANLKAELIILFKILGEYGAEFGFRAAKEMARYLHFHKTLSGGGPVDFHAAMDAQIVQKLLPKLHGSRNKLTSVLWALAAICEKDYDWKVQKDEVKHAKGFDDFMTAVNAAVEVGDEKFDPARMASKLRLEKREALYPLSFDKIARMWAILEANGFVSFAEA